MDGLLAHDYRYFFLEAAGDGNSNSMASFQWWARESRAMKMAPIRAKSLSEHKNCHRRSDNQCNNYVPRWNYCPEELSVFCFLIERIYSGLLGNQQGIRLSAGYQRELLNLYVQFSIMVTTRKTSVNIDPSTSLTMIPTIQISINGPGTSSASLLGFIRYSFNYK